jgi:hypothetical protein
LLSNAFKANESNGSFSTDRPTVSYRNAFATTAAATRPPLTTSTGVQPQNSVESTAPARRQVNTVNAASPVGCDAGFIVPIFFVVTGLRYDLHALLSSTKALLLLPMFLVLFLGVRGLPALLAHRDLDLRSRIALGLLSATQLPLVVAIVEIGVRSGQLNLEAAASLVGAGMFSVLLFPIAALSLRGRTAPRHDTSADSTPEKNNC